MSRRARSLVALPLLLLGACRSVFGIDETGVAVDDGGAGDEGGIVADGSAHDASAAKKDGGALSMGKDAGPSLCPSAAAVCQPETVVTGLLSPGELAVMGLKIAFREHAKIDGGKVSAVRVWDPAGACKQGSCLPTVTTGPNNYKLLAANAAHLCYTNESYASNEYVACVKTNAAFTLERTVTNETWFYQAEFVETDTLLFGAPITQSTRAVRVFEPTTNNPPYSVVSNLTGSVDYVTAHPDAVAPWFGWVNSLDPAATDQIGARSVGDPKLFSFIPQTRVVGLTSVGDNLVWLTDYEIRVARYTAGIGTALPNANVVTCDQGTSADYKQIAPAPNAVVAVEGCDIPGSLGSKIVYYPLDGSAPTLLATALSAVSSVVVLGDYVYYAISRLPADISDVPTEELRRVRFR
jgi:hypothetical protein